jgi:hypothetical protein
VNSSKREILLPTGENFWGPPFIFLSTSYPELDSAVRRPSATKSKHRNPRISMQAGWNFLGC